MGSFSHINWWGIWLVFWKDKKTGDEKIRKYFLIDGLIGSAIFYYFVRKIQIFYDVDISIDGYGLAGAAWYGLGLGFVFGVKFIRVNELIAFFRKK